MKEAEGIEDEEGEEVEEVENQVSQNEQQLNQNILRTKPIWPYRYFGDYTHFDDLFGKICLRKGGEWVSNLPLPIIPSWCRLRVQGPPKMQQ